MNRFSFLSLRHRAFLLFFATVFTLFGALFATVRAQEGAPDAVILTLNATTPSGIPNVAFLGERITYTLRITNTGAGTLNEVLLIDDLPRDTFDEYECSGCRFLTETQTFPDPLGGVITVTIISRISWDISTLTPGQVVIKTFSAKVVGQPDGAEFTNRAFAYYLVDGSPTTVNSNDSIVASRVQLPQDGNLALSSAATWFSDDFGGTLSQDWGDFDQDGDLDLLLGSSIATTIYRNDDGDVNRFWTTERTAYGVRWLDIGAVNYSFVAVGASIDETAVTTGTNVIYTFNPNATNAATRFLEVDTFLSDLQLIRVQPGDINKDGWVDLVATTNAINAECPTQIFLHSGDPATPYDDLRTACASNDASAAIALGDADNDDDLDLASGRFASQDATLLFNTLEATSVLTDVIFTDTNSVPIETGLSFLPYDFSWGDFDNDGLLDLAAAYPLEREARVYRNLGGTFADPIVIRTAVFRTPLAVDWGDFDNDGTLELAVADATPRIYHISSDRTVTQIAALDTNAIPIGTQLWSIRGVDQDNDNDLDLALANRDGPTQIFTLFSPFLDTQIIDVDSEPASSVAWGDADGDGTQDLLLGAGPPSTNGFGTRLYYNQGGRFQPSQSDQITGFGPHIVAFGDVNKDGRLDIALGTTAQTQIYLADQLTSPAWISPYANANKALAWGDYDHDGDLDLLVGSASATFIYRKRGALLENREIWRSDNPGDDTRAVAWVDFDGDKLLDFVIGNNGQPHRLYRNIGRNQFEPVPWNPQVSATRAVAWGDYDRDGDMDLAIADYNGSVLLYANLTIDVNAPEPTLSDTPFVLPASNHRPTALAWGDWDNDGDLDLAVGQDGFNIQVYSNQTRNAETPNFAWVWASELSYNATGVAWGDFDNDGDLDLGISQNGSGTQRNGVFTNGFITPSHLRDFETTIPLPDNSSYVQVERPGQTDEAFFYSAPDILSGPVQPTVAIRYRVYDPDGSRDPTIPNPAGDGIVRTLFEYSLDGGGTWQTASPGSESTPTTTTSRLGVEGLFLWDAQADEAISDNTLFRVRVVPVTRTGSRSRGAAVGVSSPFRVRGTTCEWPENATITISPTHPLPGTAVSFTGAITAGTGIISYVWDFGDGTTVQGQTVSHTYTRQDQFNVLLTVNGPPCPLNYPAYAETMLTVGDPVIGPDVFLPLIGRNNDNGDVEEISDTRPWAEEITRIPPSRFQPTPPTIKPGTATMALENLCIAPNQVSDTPVGISNQPVINSDGSRIAFWSTGDIAPTSESNNSDGNIEIFLWRRDTPATPFYQVTKSLGTILGGLSIAPTISANGNRIAFFSDRDLTGDNGDGTFEVFAATVGTTGTISITQVTTATRTSSIFPSISGDGRRIAYISDELGSPDVYVATLNPDGTANQPTRVSTFSNATVDQPVISANGQVIAFISNGNLNNGNPESFNEIFVARNTSGSIWTIQQVTDSDANTVNTDIDLNGNGSALVFISTAAEPDNADRNAEVFVAELGSSITISQITNSTGTVTQEHPTISDDASRIAFISNANAGGIGTDQKRVFLYDRILNTYGEVSNQTNANNSEPMLNSAGDRITFVSNISGDREVFRLDCFVADIGITASVDPDPLVPGAPLTYTYSIQNTGPNDAVTTTVAITFPAEVLSVTASPPACVVDQQSHQVNCALGTVPANQSRLIRVRGTLDGEARDTLTANGLVESETFDRNLTNDTTLLETTVQPELSLVLDVTDAPDPAVAGTPLTYTLRVVNQGPSTATGIEVRDTFPPALLNPILIPNPACTLTGSQLECNYGFLLPEGQQVITVTGMLDSFTRNTVSNTATVQSNEYPLDTSTETTTILANVALTTTITEDPQPVQAGETVTFTVAVSNSGPSGATAIVAQTTIPTDVTGLAVTPSASCPVPTTNTVTCNFPVLNPNATRTYTITGVVAPTARGNRTITTRVSAAELSLPLNTTQPFTIAATVDLDLELTVDPESPVAGESLTYLFTVLNNGPATANDIRIEDQYDTQLNLTAIDPGCQPSGVQSVVCRLTTLAPNASESFTLTGTIDPSTTGTLTNTASVIATEILTPEIAILDTPITANVSLVVTPTIQPATLIAGDAVTYTLTVVNRGPSDATNVTLTGTLTTLLSPDVIGACTRDDDIYTCNFGTLQPNDPRIVVASGIIPPTQRGTLANSAFLTSDEQPTPQVVPLNRPIEADVNLTFNLSADPTGDVIAGQPIEYTLTAANAGRSTALNISFTDTFEFLVNPTASPGCTRNGNTFTCPVTGGIALNETAVVTVTGVVSPSAPSPLDNFGALIWGEPIIGETYTDSITSNVLADIDFDIDLSPTSAVTVTAGEALTYTVGVTNTGDSVAPGVAVTGTLANLTNATVTIVGGSACPITSGIYYNCALGNLAAQTGSRSVRINGTVIPTVRGTLTNTVAITAQVTPTVTVNRQFSNPIRDDVVLDVDTLVIPTPSPRSGETVEYRFGITNTGDSTALNVVLVDTLTKVLTPTISFVTTQGGCAIANLVVTCSLGSLPKNTPVLVTISGTVDPSARTSINNDYTISSPDISTIAASLNRLLVANTTLNLNVTASSTVTAGLPLSYTVSLTNNGPSTATTTRLTGTLTSLINITENSASCTIEGGTTLDCTVGGMNVGQVFNVQVNGTVDPTTRGTLNTPFRADSVESPAVTRTVPTTVTRDVDLAINMNSFPNGTVRAGETLLYTVTITNTGQSAALDTVVTATLISLLTPTLTITPSSDCILNVSNLIECDVDVLSPTTTYTLTYEGQVDPSKRGILTNATGVVEIDHTIALTDNKIVTVNALADLDLSVSPSSPVIAGAPLTYTLTLINNGPSTATNVEITGTLNGLQNSSSPDCTINAGVFTCTLTGGLLPDVPYTTMVIGDIPGTRRTNIVNTFGATSIEDSDFPPPVTSPVGANVQLDVDISATGTVTASAPLTFTAAFTNDGVSTALTTVLTYTYSNFVAAPTTTVNGGVAGTCTPNHALQRVVCTFANTLGGEDAGSVTIRGTLIPTLPLTTTHSAFISAQNPITSASDTINVTRGSAYPVSLDITATGIVTNSAPLTYTFLLANITDAGATSLILTGTYPASFIAAPTVTTPAGANCTTTHINRRVVCTLPTLAAGAEARVLVRGTLSTTLPTTIGSNAILRVTTPSVTVNDSLTLQRNTSTPFQFNITASGTVTASQPITYTLHITNTGPLPATTVVVTDTYANQFPNAPTAQVISGPPGTCNVTHASRRVVCTFNNYPPNAVAKVRIVSTLANMGIPSTIGNTATLRSTNPNLTITDSLTLDRGTTYLVALWLSQTSPWWMVLPFFWQPLLNRKKKARR